MKFSDESSVRGYLSIYKDYGNGRRECVLDNDPNTITYKSRETHLRYLYDYDNAPKDELVSFKIGKGGAVGDSSQGNTNVKVIPPDPTANDLYSPTAISHDTLDSINPSGLPTDIYLRVIFTISQEEANGSKINECGIFKTSGDMFNHKTFASIEKNEVFSIIFEWTLRYV